MPSEQRLDRALGRFTYVVELAGRSAGTLQFVQDKTQFDRLHKDQRACFACQAELKKGSKHTCRVCINLFCGNLVYPRRVRGRADRTHPGSDTS